MQTDGTIQGLQDADTYALHARTMTATVTVFALHVMQRTGAGTTEMTATTIIIQ